jgi:hypothetical protein
MLHTTEEVTPPHFARPDGARDLPAGGAAVVRSGPTHSERAGSQIGVKSADPHERLQIVLPVAPPWEGR